MKPSKPVLSSGGLSVRKLEDGLYAMRCHGNYALDSVSKHNFSSPFASTEWSVVYDQTNGEARYCHREDYSRFFPFSVR